MKNRLKDIWRFIEGTADEHMGAFSSQSAFFLFLSFFPLINLLAVIPTFLPISKEQVMEVIYYVVPAQFENFITGLVNSMYMHGSGSITIFSVVIAVWSAAKGIMAIRNGLNEVFRCREYKNYLIIRGISAVYTVVFIILVIVLVILNMFGTQIANYVVGKFPEYVDVTSLVYHIKSTATFILLFFMFEFLYVLVPNKKQKFLRQIPGALFTSLSWIIVTKLFSLYIDYYASKSYMYGAVTTIIMLMFWLQLVIYLMFVGAQVNVYLETRKNREKEFELSKYTEGKDEVWDDDELSDTTENLTEQMKYDVSAEEDAQAEADLTDKENEEWEDDDIKE